MRDLTVYVRLLLLIIALAAPACTAELPAREDRIPIALDAVPLQHGAGGEYKTTFSIAPDEWSTIRAMFEPPADAPREERLAIRQAIGTLETIAGEQAGTHVDLGKNRINPLSGVGRMDCIDESTNTTNYLLLLEQEGLLHHHTVCRKVFRGPLQFDVHFGAQIEETATGRRFVVDSWFLDNGQPPYIQPVNDWMKKRDFPPEENPGADPSPP